MSAIKKTYEQLHEFNGEAGTYLKKAGQVNDKGIPEKQPKHTKFDLALLDLLMKQLVKKILVEKRKKVRSLEVEHALCDPTTKEVLFAERANPKFGIPHDIFKMDKENTKALDLAIEALEKEEVEIHPRSVREADMPVLTEEETEAFITSGYIIIEPTVKQ